MANRFNVLIIDDESEARNVIVRALRKEEVRVLQAACGEEGLEVVAREDVDVVFLDVRLPGLSGIEVLRELKQRKPGIEVIVMTAYGTINLAVQSMKEGAADFLTKPFEHNEIIALSLHKALERKRLLAELEQSRQEQIKVKDQFLSHVSHELRSPLTAIYEFVTILLDGLAGELSPEQREYLEITLKNVSQLHTMISDLLAVTRTERGVLTVRLRPTYIAGLAEDALDTLRLRMSAKDIAVFTDFPDDLPPVYADPDRVREILINLIDNAIKFTPENGEVTVWAQIFREDPGFLCVAVADTGCGINPEDSKKIFEYLYQGENTTGVCRKGFGLGLYLSQESVSRQGGRIWFESQPGEGSVFYFTLPIFSLARFLLPLITENNHLRDSIALITVDVFPAGASPSVKVEETMRKRVQDILQRCIIPVRDVLLPKTVYPGEDGAFFIMVSTDQSGAQVVIQRIQEQLALHLGLKNVNYSVVVSFAMVELPAGEDTKPVEQLVEEVAKSIEERMNTMFHRGRDFYDQKKISRSG